MPLPDFDSSVGHSFGLEFDGVVIKQISEVSGLKFEQDVIELKQNTHDGKYIIKKLPGRPKAGEVTLTRGLTDDKNFQNWVQKSQFGKMADARKGGAVIVYDYEGQAIKHYKLTNAWPKSLELGTLKAGDTSVVTDDVWVVSYLGDAGYTLTTTLDFDSHKCVAIASNDIVYGDIHGVLTIPADVVAEVPRVAALMNERERRVVELCLSPEFTLDNLRSAVGEIE